MKRRTTENRHLFTENLFKELNAYSVENITMDSNRNFTAVIEAVEFLSNENIDIKNVFSKEEIDAKLIMSKNLNIPFYYIAYQNNCFNINEVLSYEEVNLLYRYDELSFINWWLQNKGTTQTHPLNNGGLERAYNTIFDRVLDKYGLKWGGNIDGFIINNDKVKCIIDNISISFVDITNYKADPARFFHLKGPKYETWYSTVKLANLLKIPHLLLTIDKRHPSDEIVGISVIESLSKNGIKYNSNIRPPDRIVRGLKNIKNEIMKLIQISSPPTLI